VTPLDGGGVSIGQVVAFSGSTVLGRFRAPIAVGYGWPRGGPLLAMNARGDAVLAISSCCPNLVHTFRRAPFGAFDEADVVAEPPPAASDLYQQQLSDLQLDPFGNAAATWLDTSSGSAQLDIAADGPAQASAPPIVPPSPLDVVSLLPNDTSQPAGQAGPTQPWLGAVVAAANAAQVSSPAPALAAPAGATRPATPARGRLAVAIARLPGAAGTARIVVAVQCPAACRTSVTGTLVTPTRARLRLPRLAVTADAGQRATATLRLSPAASRVLRARSGHGPRRRFQLSVTAIAGDTDGQPQTSTVAAAFLRR
jgi:hypothetical protein